MSQHTRSIWSFLLLVVLVGGLMPAALPVAAADEWYAEYFPNVSLAGSPALSRTEQGLTFDWGTGSPGTGIPADGFSARFTRDMWFDNGTYRFTYRADDGLRLWVNDVLIINEWNDGGAVWMTVDHFIPGGVHRVRVEYYERTGLASMQVAWSKIESGHVWDASFWDNTTLSGTPVLQRQDVAIDFDWGTGSPDPKVPADNFSARWTRTLGFQPGTYRFYASVDDGVRIFVNGHRVVNAWQTQMLPNTHFGDIALGPGNHKVVVEYFEQGGAAAVHVWWDRVDQIQGWEGRYYDNRDLRGGPALIRDDAEINFDWGQGAPVTWMSADNFSVQWTRTINFRPGYYRFNSRSDDGMRLWINDANLLMNHWEPQEATWHYQDWHWLEGPQTLRVEYFEGTGTARMQFWWDYAPTAQAASAMAPSPVYGFRTAPAAQPTPVVPRTPGVGPTPIVVAPIQTPGAVQTPGPWVGEYFAGRDLTQTPVLIRTDPAIDFNWGWKAPSEELPVDNFAVRWTGTFTFEGGRYRFRTTTDDGVRLYINDRLVINSWRPMRGTRTVTLNLTPGEHTVRMEYFEATQAARAHLTWQRLGR
jgi:hypothetical protein